MEISAAPQIMANTVQPMVIDTINLEENNFDFPVEEFEILNEEAEARLASRRAAREEARKIRIKELEKEQREIEERQDRHYDIVSQERTTPRVYNNNHRAESEDSEEEEDNRELRKEFNELDDKYKKAMISNAQLDNEKQTYRYQVDLLKDRLEETEEEHLELERQHRETCRELDQKKRDYKDLQDEKEYYKQQMDERDRLIKEYGLVFVSNDTVEDTTEKKRKKKKKTDEELESAALVRPDAVEILKNVAGNLDDRLRKMAYEKENLEEEISKLNHQLDDEKEKNALSKKWQSPSPQPQAKMNGPSEVEVMELQMDSQKHLNDYKFKLRKAEQDITTLEGTVIRLESQVKRFKSAAENSEKGEDDLKTEKRKLQRELREAKTTIEELNTQNHHLQRRIEKIKSARGVLLN